MRCRYCHSPRWTDTVTVLVWVCPETGHLLGEGVAGGERSPQPASPASLEGARLGEGWGAGALGCSADQRAPGPGSHRGPSAVTRRRSPASPWDGPALLPALCAGTGGAGSSPREAGLRQQSGPSEPATVPFLSCHGHRDAKVTLPASIEPAFTLAV